MKNFKIFIALFMLMGLVACSGKNEEQLEGLKGETLSPEAFFEKVSATNYNLSQEKALLISYEYNAENKTITLLSSEEAEPSWGIALDVVAQLNENKAKYVEQHSYKVNCANGENSWSKNCDGKYSCGSAIYKCLEQGGCATICKTTMLYVPEVKTFYLSETLSDLTTP